MTVKNLNQSFEIKKVTNDSIIYQRIRNPLAKKNKKHQEILENLPTATLHTISQEEYEHLKSIEIKLLDEIELKKPNENRFKQAFLSFFELT